MHSLDTLIEELKKEVLSDIENVFQNELDNFEETLKNCMTDGGSQTEGYQDNEVLESRYLDDIKVLYNERNSDLNLYTTYERITDQFMDKVESIFDNNVKEFLESKLG